MITTRNYTEQDAPFLAAIFFNTIHQVNSKDYSPEQLDAWAPASSLEVGDWLKKWQKVMPIVAILENKIVGFVELEDHGHIDCLYCHHEYQRCGVGSALMAAVEQQAQQKNLSKLFVEVSITAKPFFEAKGFSVKKEQSVNVRGVWLTNFVMEKCYQ